MHSSSLSTDTLDRRLGSLGFFLSENALEGLASYLALLTKWNRAMNLVGTRSWEETLEALIVDSFHLAGFLPGIGLPAQPVCFDLGAGGGLPGIPLRLIWRDGVYTLVEAREKRALFMRTVLAAVDLGRTSVFHGRAEDFFQQSACADLIISRAFMPWRELLKFVSGALAPDGRIVFLTLAPPPEDIPPPWKLATQSEYAAAGAKRYFWCFTRKYGECA